MRIPAGWTLDEIPFAYGEYEISREDNRPDDDERTEDEKWADELKQWEEERKYYGR